MSKDILVFENILTPEFCDHLIKKFEKSTLMKGYDNQGYAARTGEILDITDNPEWVQEDQDLHKIVGGCVQRYRREYPGIDIETDTGYQLTKYNPGEECISHVDGWFDTPSSGLIRTGVLILFLNTTDSPTVFPRQETRIYPRQGRAVMFPPYYTHPHYVAPVTEDRYIIITRFATKFNKQVKPYNIVNMGRNAVNN